MKHKPRRQLLYILARIAVFPLYLLPLKVGVALGAFFGSAAYYILPRERKKTLRHLKIAFGDEKTEAELVSIAKRLFSNLGRNALEWVNYNKTNKDWYLKHVKPEGRENIDRAHQKGKGVIFLCSHFGNWEFMGFYLAQTGYPGPTIAKRFYIEGFNKLLERMRTDMGMGVVYRDGSPKEILRTLRNNGYVGIVADQDVRSVEGVFVNFFGKPAYTPSAPVRLAQKTKAAIVPVFLIREASNKFLFIAEREIELISTGDVEKDLITNTQKWTDLIESYIRKHPDHWVWMHRRWKTRPEDIKNEK